MKYWAPAMAMTMVTMVVGCTTPTQVVVYVTADAPLAERADSLRLQIYDGTLAEVSDQEHPFGADLPRLHIAPAQVTVVPSTDDEEGTFRVVASLRDADGEFAQQEVVASYVRRELREIRIHISEGCLGVECGTLQACVDGACTDACVVASSPGGTSRSEYTQCDGCFGRDDGEVCRSAGDDGRCYAGACCTGCWDSDAQSCRDGDTASTCGAAGAECTNCGCGDGCLMGACQPSTRVPRVFAEHQHTCVNAGQVHCWGLNDVGQVGNGTTENVCEPVAVRSAAGTLDVGEQMTCASSASGYSCWGTSGGNRLGSWFEDQLTPPESDAEHVFSEITVGRAHGCGIVDGRVWCWGGNFSGDYLRGTPDPLPAAPSPVPVPIENATSLDAARLHTCAIGDGDLWCWGRNSDGAVGVPYVVASPGTAPTQVHPEHEWARVSAGWAGTCAITTEGDLYCWGDIRRFGWLSDTSRSHEAELIGTGPWFRVSVGTTHVCGIKMDGSLHCIGQNESGQRASRQPAGIAREMEPAGPIGWRWRDLAAGDKYTCAVRDDFTLYCWGSGEFCATTQNTNTGEPVRVCIPE